MIDETEDTKIQARDRNRERYYNKSRNTYLKWKYGITLQDYNSILEKQCNSCAVCGNADAGVRGRYNTFCVDHDHKTGKVRGLLCTSCNIAVVPTVEYYETRLENARTYLREHGTLK